MIVRWAAVPCLVPVSHRTNGMPRVKIRRKTRVFDRCQVELSTAGFRHHFRASSSISFHEIFMQASHQSASQQRDRLVPRRQTGGRDRRRGRATSVRERGEGAEGGKETGKEAAGGHDWFRTFAFFSTFLSTRTESAIKACQLQCPK